jgi:hypothetical protein
MMDKDLRGIWNSFIGVSQSSSAILYYPLRYTVVATTCRRASRSTNALNGRLVRCPFMSKTIEGRV